MGRYFTLLRMQLRTSALLAAQYRWDFLIDGALSLFWAATAVIPLFVVYTEGRASIPGWSFDEAMIVVGWFIWVQGVLEGAINPGLAAVVEHIRKGTLDFVLLKPADAQFLVSTSRFQLWRVASLITALAIFVVVFNRLGRSPALFDIGLSVLLMLVAVLTLYSMWILIISAAFYVVKIDNLNYLFTSIFDAGRWPISVFKGGLRLLFTFVVPLALMTTFPAEALLGRMGSSTLAISVGAALVFATASRWVWRKSLRHYTSASS